MGSYSTGSGQTGARAPYANRQALYRYHNETPQYVVGGVLARSRRTRITTTILTLVSFALGLMACIFFFALLLPGLTRTHATAHAAAPTPIPTQVIPPAAAYPEAEKATGRTTILLLGSDQRPDDPGFRTDVMLLVNIDADQGTVSAVSFPRDLWVEVPDLYPMKINMIQGLGGFEATANALQANFGVRPDYYVMTNFEGFVSTIDRLGGIEVNVGQALADSCDLPQAVNGQCQVEPGLMPMDGSTALWYVRSRGTSSDFDRLRRAQEVSLAVFNRLMHLNMLQHLPELQEAYASSIETNVPISKAMSLLPIAAQVSGDPTRIKRFAIGEEQAYPSWSWDGMWILLPDPEAVRGVLIEAGILQ